MAKDLSGGMRRRLSVAIALAGGSKIIFLDEPSTGLDPKSRHLLWDIIHQFVNSRCVILTTHSMDEAEDLCSQIGIMANGKLLTEGTPHELKHKFGLGYRLEIAFPEESKEIVQQTVSELFETAKATQVYKKHITYQITENDIRQSLSNVQQLEDLKQNGTITNWELNQTSLEDVFLNVIASDNNQQEIL